MFDQTGRDAGVLWEALTLSNFMPKHKTAGAQIQLQWSMKQATLHYPRNPTDDPHLRIYRGDQPRTGL